LLVEITQISKNAGKLGREAQGQRLAKQKFGATGHQLLQNVVLV
jgi:hypothetical protein